MRRHSIDHGSHTLKARKRGNMRYGAEANHAKNKVLQEQLDQLCDRIESVLSKYTDADV